MILLLLPLLAASAVIVLTVWTFRVRRHLPGSA
jgi:hypothetical protein